jgi:hypothetical protein
MEVTFWRAGLRRYRVEVMREAVSELDVLARQ